jgi:two-component system cell cycle response regulator CtrA
MRLLVIDNIGTTHAMLFVLRAAGFNIEDTDLGEEGVDLAKRFDFDAVLVGGGLLDISGLDVLRRIRAAKVSAPVLIISDDQSTETRVAAYDSGADDYLPKPIHKDELVARVRAVIRRSRGHAEAVINAGPIKVLLDQKRVEVGGERINLTGREYQLLELLALRKGSTLSKDAILTQLYGGMDEPESGKIIEVFVCKVRAKLRKANADGHIQNVWGRGYVLQEVSAPVWRPTAKVAAERQEAA